MIRGDYIPGSDRRYFYNISIRELRVSTEHRMILAELRGVCREMEPQIPHREIHMAHCGPEEGLNARRLRRFHRPLKGDQ